MRGRIETKNSSLTKLRIINIINKKNISESETLLLDKLIQYSVNNSVTLDKGLIAQIKEELDIKDSNFTTTIFRLVKNNCIRKEGRTVNLLPIYRSIGEIKSLLIDFN